MAWAVGIEQQYSGSCLGHTPGGLSPLPEVWHEDQQALQQYACLLEGSHASSWEHRGSLRDACSENRSTDRRKGSDLHCKSRCKDAATRRVCEPGSPPPAGPAPQKADHFVSLSSTRLFPFSKHPLVVPSRL